MANGIKSTEVVQQGSVVQIGVTGAFLAVAIAKGDVTLWPDKAASQVSEAPVLSPTYWLFTFDSPQEAAKFAADAETKIAAAKADLAWTDPL